MIPRGVTIVGMPEREPSDVEMFEWFRTYAFEYARMRRAIRFDRITGKLDLEEWHDRTVPRCYRARVAEIALVTFEQFRNRMYSDELCSAFVSALRRDIYKHLEPIAPPMFRTHDDPIGGSS